MANYNKVMLMGNLTRDIEVRQTPNGTSVANIGLAVNRRFKGANGEQQEETTFVDCEAWGRTAEVMAQYLAKGRPVFIEGRLKLDQWQDKDGGNRSKLKVVVEGFQFVDSRGGGGGGGGGGGQSGGSSYDDSGNYSKSSTRSSGGGGGSNFEAIDDDDIPF